MEKEIIIIPDVHGRDFWRDSVIKTLTNTSANIVFLGDYTDPYNTEWDYGFDYRQHTIDNFKEIIELKKQYPNRVTLLLGNHDCGYAIGDNICSSRMDHRHYEELKSLFQDNRELFQIAKESDIAGKHFVFSHAGILRGWANYVWGEGEVNDPNFNVVNKLNQAWLDEQYEILESLCYYDSYRGWGGYQYGSPVWSDIRSWVMVTPEETFGFNIVGHTQLDQEPIVFDTIADIDLRKTFFIDDQGRLCDYGTGEELKKTEI